MTQDYIVQGVSETLSIPYSLLFIPQGQGERPRRMDSVVIKPYFGGPYPYSYPLSQSSDSFTFFKFACFNKLKRSSISVSFRPNNPNSPNPIPKCNNQNKTVTPSSNLFPVLRRIKDLASKSKWGSILRRSIGSESAPEGYLQNGGFGIALLSVTSTARGRLSPFMAILAANPTFVSGLFAWVIAQSVKVILNFFVEKKWDLKILFASGGMPSSHSALCTALTTSVAICHGVADSLFPVCLGFSLIVMYDAAGVRRHAGMQAEVILYFL